MVILGFYALGPKFFQRIVAALAGSLGHLRIHRRSHQIGKLPAVGGQNPAGIRHFLNGILNGGLGGGRLAILVGNRQKGKNYHQKRCNGADQMGAAPAAIALRLGEILVVNLVHGVIHFVVHSRPSLVRYFFSLLRMRCRRTEMLFSLRPNFRAISCTLSPYQWRRRKITRSSRRSLPRKWSMA